MCKSSLHRECLHCGTDIVGKRSDAKYCSSKCQAKGRDNEARDQRRAAKARYREENRGNLKEKQRLYYEANREEYKNTKLLQKYGITLEERDRMFAEQDGKCKVCDDHLTLESLKANSAHVDHCHTTGAVHGLLCARCNQAAGLLGENPEITAKLTAYLLDTAKVPTR